MAEGVEATATMVEELRPSEEDAAVEHKRLDANGRVLVYFDFETTGTIWHTDRVTQIGAIYQDKDGKDQLFVQYVYTAHPMHPEAARITGITNESLEEKRKEGIAIPFEQAVIKFLVWLKRVGEQITLVAYNGATFDVPMLVAEMERIRDVRPAVASTATLFKSVGVCNLLDPLPWNRKRGDESCAKYGFLRNPETGKYSFSEPNTYEALFKKKLEGAHEAENDVRGLRAMCEHEAFEGMPTDAVCSHYRTFENLAVSRVAKAREKIEAAKREATKAELDARKKRIMDQYDANVERAEEEMERKKRQKR